MSQLYSGDLLPKNVWSMLSNTDNSYLVDVRTGAELYYVGIPDLQSVNKQLIKIEWRLGSNMQVNPEFFEKLNSAIPDKDGVVIFICRTGGRSMEAAAYAKNTIGYKECYNTLYGFEGDLNSKKQRGMLNGWKADSLPWSQN